MPIFSKALMERFYDTAWEPLDQHDVVFDVDDLPPCVLSQLEVSHDPESLRSAAPAACAPVGEPVLPDLGPGAVDFARIPDGYANAAAHIFAGGGLVVPRRNPDTDAYYRPFGV